MNNDLISRDAAIALAYFHGKASTWDNPMSNGVDAVDVASLEKLPAVQIEPKAGHWFDIGSLSCRCSECGTKNSRESNYCPNCGAYMKGKNNDKTTSN